MLSCRTSPPAAQLQLPNDPTHPFTSYLSHSRCRLPHNAAALLLCGALLPVHEHAAPPPPFSPSTYVASQNEYPSRPLEQLPPLIATLQPVYCRIRGRCDCRPPSSTHPLHPVSLSTRRPPVRPLGRRAAHELFVRSLPVPIAHLLPVLITLPLLLEPIILPLPVLTRFCSSC
ncbi:hypothetical protein C8J57DRAFT_1274365 [Mycena rebaudengoi]|nr:hypothetical protein C8J57DRAFT_1274365 [Mycena rebaudengoi]